MSFRSIYGHTYSENGWRMVNRNGCVVANPTAWSNTAPVRSGDAATILNAWLIWYSRNVEALISPVWGWSATNQVATSNHLSGTALDINAVKYPWGLRVMPGPLKAKIREGLRLFEGTVFWGADWSYADEMHFQLGYREGDGRIPSFAGKLNRGHLGVYGTPTPAPAPKPVPNLINVEAEVASAWIGDRLHEKEREAIDGGKYADYTNGSIYWHPEHTRRDGEPAATAVPSAIYDVWERHNWEQGFLGYPILRHDVVEGGDIQAFQGGIVYRKHGTDGAAVHGIIGDRWYSEGAETGPLGWPVSAEEPHGDGRVQRFEHGRLLWDPSGAVEIRD